MPQVNVLLTPKSVSISPPFHEQLPFKKAQLSIKHRNVGYSTGVREEVTAALVGQTHHMHCTVWVPNPDGQKIPADEKLNLVFLLNYNIQARVNFLVSPHIWRRNDKKNVIEICVIM